MIPKGLTAAHFEKAAKEIDRNGIPSERASVHYDLVLNGKKYPPKYMISIAAKYLNGDEWPPGNFNAVEAKNYFESQGYKVIDRRKEKTEQHIAVEDDESAFPEGKELFRLHRSRERDASLSKKAKEKRLKQTGALRCDVCGFSFFDVYGDLGEGFIEAHHTIPLSELKGDRKTKIAELALVCSNCHRMLHRAKPMLSIDQLRNLVAKLSET